jgi:hypothetical protein
MDWENWWDEPVCQRNVLKSQYNLLSRFSYLITFPEKFKGFPIDFPTAKSLAMF